MDRRRFLKTASASCVAGTAVPAASRLVAGGVAPRSGKTAVRKPLTAYTAEDHRQRLENISICERSIDACLKKHLITSYLPGQAYYNLGEYPSREPWEPSEYDDRELDRLRDHGIELIQVWLDWCDELRLFGGDKFNPGNPVAFRQFVDKVHARGMKIIPYTSAGYFERRDPDFRPEWSRSEKQDLRELCWDWGRCSYASPGWRAYLLPRLARLMDDYGVDGLYNDMGYGAGVAANKLPPADDEVLAFEETDDDDGYLTDLLGLIYDEVKRRAGIVKLHRGGTQRPKTKLKVYDYLWVGEGGRNGDRLREAVKDHPPYVVPCLDMSRATIEDENELYLHAIPYMQFPFLSAGRPFTGERAATAGIEYTLDRKDFWSRHYLAIREHYKAHPDGPYSYSQWDSAIPRPEARPTHARWLKQYMPIVEEGTWAWLELGESNLFAAPLPNNVVASAFANRELFLVLANYSNRPVELATVDAFASVSKPSEPGRKAWKLDARSLHILRRPRERRPS
ncbi:MAG: hypothetical protein HQ582_30430 [Planctomycetes bacterium]|nr:hypothetical protein [Planctomycetota bacterium]